MGRFWEWRRARSTKIPLVGVCTLALSCASATVVVNPSEVADDARADLMAATAKYQDEKIKLRGKVVDKGLRKASSRRISIVGLGDMAVGRAYTERETYGYLVLEGRGESPGKVICFFQPDYLKDLARVEEGSTVTTGCTFSEYVGKKKAPVGVFMCGFVDELHH